MDRSVDASTKVNLVNIHGWRGYNNPWMLEEETDSEYSYINLLANPERYTGYKVIAKPLKGGFSCEELPAPLGFVAAAMTHVMHPTGLLRLGSLRAEKCGCLHMQGEHAHRVWNLIYSQSCFTDVMQPDVCTERKVFYRLISGEGSQSHVAMPCLGPCPQVPLLLRADTPLTPAPEYQLLPQAIPACLPRRDRQQSLCAVQVVPAYFGVK